MILDIKSYVCACMHQVPDRRGEGEGSGGGEGREEGEGEGRGGELYMYR